MLLELALGCSLGVAGMLILLTARSLSRNSIETPTGSDTEKYLKSVAQSSGVHLCRLKPSTLEAICGYDPTAGGRTARQMFAPIQNNTHCIFAKRAKLWAAPDWDASLTIEETLSGSLRAFALFCTLQQGVDGFLFAVPAPDDSLVGHGDVDASLEAHSALVARILRHLRYISYGLQRVCM
jgi:hypothetical protein